MFEQVDDTIVAVSSPPGRGVRGIVRLSGPDAIRIADTLCAAVDGALLAGRPGFSHAGGFVEPEPGVRVPAEVYLFRAPRSYTRQHCVEIHTVGSPAALAMVVEAVVARGARPADPGEFTARAFLSGAMDLGQAEAVAAAIAARSDAQLRAAHRLRQGELTRRIVEWRDRLAELVALVEADIDFAEEPIEFITPVELRRRLAELSQSMVALQAGADSTERFEVLPTILLIGRPNVGKSSLLNALSGIDRAICSAVAGTTRDILSVPVRLGAAEALLLDAAGLHEDADELMRQAQRLVLSAAEHVDLLCLVVDLSTEPDGHEFDCLWSVPATPCILAGNKADLVGAEAGERRAARLGESAGARAIGSYAVSALTGTGLDRLRDVLATAIRQRDDLGEDRAVMLNARQRRCLEEASAAVRRAIAEAENIRQTLDRADVLAFELRDALDALGETVGAVTTEDLLSTVFSRFCIGK